MFNNSKRKEERLNSRLPDTLNASSYNMVIGGCLAYGFLMNAIMVMVASNFFMEMNPIVFLIGYIVCVIAGSFMTSLSRNPIVSFIGYNLIVVPIGALLAVCIPSYDPADIIAAVVVTAMITGVMMLLGIMFREFFSKLGIVLFVSLLVGIVIEFIAMLLGYGGDIFNWLFVIIFSLYIGYDWHKAQAYPKTLDNAIDSAVDLYLDIINIFIRLLEIFGKKD
jgi:FtsH-binding integral membrane protein